MFAPETRVLVVEDMKAVRMSIVKILNELGFQSVVEADSGKSAMDAIEGTRGNIGQRFGLIICDLHMPPPDGLKVLKNVRNDKDFKNTPFLILTAESDRTSVVEALGLGVNDYVIKPAVKATLEKKLKKVYADIQAKVS